MTVTATTPGALVLLTRISRQVYREATPEVLGMGLKQFVLLNLVGEAGVPQRLLSDHLCLDANNMVLLLNEAERSGWVERRRDPADRRRHLVYRTDAGTAALAAAERSMDGIEEKVLGALEPEQRKALWALLSAALTD